MANSQKIVMIGPYPKDYIHGGMEAVLSVYLESPKLEKYNIEYLAAWYEFNKIKMIITFIRCLYRLLFLFVFYKVPLVHVHMAAWGSFYRKAILILLAKIFRKNVILHLHGSEFNMFYERSARITKWLVSKTFDSVDVIIVLSKLWLDHVKSKTANNNIKILYNPVFIRPLPKKLKRKNKREKSVLFIGTLMQRKGIYDLLHAIPEIVRRYPSAQFNICGDGDLDECERYCNEKNILEHVEFCGWVTGKEKSEKLQSADLFVLPSYNEGLPVAILEAMAASLPIISTYVGGIPDIIKNGENGFLIKPGDVDGLIESIVTLLQDDVLRNKIAVQNANMAREYFDADVVINELREIYDELLET